MKFTTTNIVLFLAISFVVVLFLYSFIPPTPSKHCGQWGKCAEGYANNNSKYPSLNKYILQIYDTLYIDTTSGNVLDIMVSSSPESTSASSLSPAPAPVGESNSAVIKQVYDRKGGNSINVGATYSVGGTTVSRVDEGTANTTSDSYKEYNVITGNNIQMFYIPSGKDTYIHVIDLSSSPPQSVRTMCLVNGETKISTTEMKMPIGINSTTYSSDSHDLSFFVHNAYSKTRTIFQVCTGIYFDNINGSLITDMERGLNVYERVSQTSGQCTVPTPYYIPFNPSNKDVYEPTSTRIVDVGFCAWTIEVVNMLVLYIGNGKETVVVVFNKKTNATSYSIINVGRYYTNGSYDDGTSNQIMHKMYEPPFDLGLGMGPDMMFQNGPDMPPCMGGSGRHTGYGSRDGDGNPLSDYYRWVDYWNKMGDPKSQEMNNYLLKSQIVPPVCPQCPMCSSANGGVCTNCGGKGGSGTLQGGNSTAAPSNADDLKSLIRDTGNGITSLLITTENNLKTILQDTGSGLKTIVQDTGTGLKSTVEDAGSGLKDLVEDAGSGVKDLVEDTGSGVKDFVQDTGSGVKDFVGDAAGGIKDIAYDVVGGAKDVAYDVVDGTKDVVYDVAGEVEDAAGEVKDIAYDVVGGTFDQLNKLGSGVERILEPNPVQLNAQAQQQQAQQQPAGPQGQPVGQDQNPAQLPQYAGYVAATQEMTPQGADYLSYFGALQPKGGVASYIPVMADFSAFRK